MATIDVLPLATRYDAVRRKRVFAFIIDVVVVALLSLLGHVLVGILGLFTFGLAWLAWGAILPAVAILYCGLTVGGARQATWGMAAMGLVFRIDSGMPANFAYGAAHVILFYLSVSFLTPLILLVSLFSPRKRLLHDMVLGVVVENVV
jgi:uncharacterized RDD family membrane protein YckC